ncbi:MAG: flagellin [Clostridium sp.]|uniref:flagellin n=1 Tax=Clostridium TaxID=1485 RepID=UPI002153883E|nr:flagellin [Clostridium sp. LY3-2]MCR6513566.1 flagellin [Clostridium sp. LY3-2]
MRLNINVNSLNIYRSYSKNLIDNKSALERISSGKKLNSAKDNPNKLGQSETMRIKLRSLQMAERNVQDTNSMLQSVDGSLDSINNSLVRMKELVVKAASDTNSLEDKKIIQEEIDSIKDGIDELVGKSEFNGVNLLKDDGVKNNYTPKYMETMIGADSGETVFIPKYNASTDKLTDKDGNKLRDLSVLNDKDAQKAISTVDDVIEQVTSMRSKYGAIASRLETTGNGLGELEGMTTKAQSQLSDADIASEIAELSRTQILNNSSLALMVQSNNLPKDALRVLERMR